MSIDASGNNEKEIIAIVYSLRTARSDATFNFENGIVHVNYPSYSLLGPISPWLSLLSTVSSLLLWAVFYLHAPRATHADISFRDPPGVYTLQNGNLVFCTDSLEIKELAAEVPGTNLVFDGEQCSFGTLSFTESDGQPDWTTAVKRAAGIIIQGAPSFLICQQMFILSSTITFIRPNERFRIRVPGFVRPSQLESGVRYALFNTSKGGCVYKEATSSPIKSSPTPTSVAKPDRTSPSKPDNKSPSSVSTPSQSDSSSSTNAGATPTKADGSDSTSLWVWLGPVIGAVATLVAAFMTVFECRRRRDVSQAADKARAEGEHV